MKAAYEVAVDRSHCSAWLGSGAFFWRESVNTLKSFLAADAAFTTDFAPEK